MYDITYILYLGNKFIVLWRHISSRFISFPLKLSVIFCREPERGFGGIPEEPPGGRQHLRHSKKADTVVVSQDDHTDTILVCDDVDGAVSATPEASIEQKRRIREAMQNRAKMAFLDSPRRAATITTDRSYALSEDETLPLRDSAEHFRHKSGGAISDSS